MSTTTIQTNTTSLEEVLEAINNLPPSGGFVKTGTFTPSETTQVFSFDVGIQPNEYDHLVIVRLNTLYHESTATTSQLIGIGIWDFKLNTESHTRTPGVNGTYGSAYTTEASSASGGRPSRVGTTISFDGYSYAPKVETGMTYRWIVWKEVE